MKRLNEAKMLWVRRAPETSALAREELVKEPRTQGNCQAPAEGELRWYSYLCSRYRNGQSGG